jgi:acetyl-CoA acetyltransferase
VAEAHLYDAVRTPFGRYGGALAGVRPDDLAPRRRRARRALAALDPARIDEVDLRRRQPGRRGQPQRRADGGAARRLPTSVPARPSTACAARRSTPRCRPAVRSRPATRRCVLVGGVESMSRAPGRAAQGRAAYATGEQTLHSTTLGWRMVNPRMPEQWTISLGASTEKLAGIHGISREAQDEFALRSHR